MKMLLKKGLFLLPVCVLATVLVTGCGNKETTTSETTTTETTTTEHAAGVSAQDSMPPLDSSAVTKPEDKLNVPKK